MTGGGEDGGGSLRLDKWLWHARFFKTRTLATKFVQAGKLRLNSALVAKPHHAVKPGDVLTFPLQSGIKVVAVKALGVRRGPATEARTLYDDLSPPPPTREEAAAAPATVAEREPGSGRPTKKERRETDRLRDPE